MPPDALFVVSARPAQIVSRDELRELPKMFTDLTHLLAEAKLTPSDVIEVMAMQYGKSDLTPAAAPQRFSNARIVVRFATPAKRQQFREWMLARAQNRTNRPMKKMPNAAVWQSDDGRIADVNPATLVLDQAESPAKTEFAPLKNPPPRWSEAWRARKDEPIVAAVDVRSWLKNGLADMDARQWLPVGELSFQTFYPLMLYVDWAVAGVDLKQKIAVSAVVQSDDKQKAERVRDTLQALLVMTRNMAGMYDMMQVPEGTPAVTEITLYQKGRRDRRQSARQRQADCG